MEQGRSGTSAYVLLMMGCALFGVGVGISFTLIGACFGIPMALVSIPMIIVGAARYSRARAARIDATISHAVSQGIAREMRPLASQEQLCLPCNLVFSADSMFCSSCGARLERRA